MFGLVELRALRQQVGAFAAGFDAALITTAEAVSMLDEAATMEKMVATIKGLAGARMAEAQNDVWGGEAETSAAQALAKKSGTTLGRAKDAIRTAQRLHDQPTLAAAARRGEVSPEQAAAISEAAAADPGVESRLVSQARRLSLRELRDEAERVRAAADRDGEARHRRIHAARFARRRSCPDGSAEVSYRSTRDDIATFWAVLQGHANAAFHAARTSGRHEPAEAYAADGMLAMAKAAAAGAGAPRGEPVPKSAPRASADGASGDGAAKSGPRASADGASGDGAPQDAAEDAPVPVVPGPGARTENRSPVPTGIVVRIDWDALVRGYPVGQETCEIAGVGQVPVSVVRAMMATGDPFLAAVVTRGVDVVNVAHLGRRPSAYQQTALDWLSPTCTVGGCDRTDHLEYDHDQDWADTHVTLLEWLNRPCSYHHDLKTNHGWAFVEGTGKRAMVPPEDPRHPKNRARNWATSDVS